MFLKVDEMWCCIYSAQSSKYQMERALCQSPLGYIHYHSVSSPIVLDLPHMTLDFSTEAPANVCEVHEILLH
jgi:hypothetical protein